MIKNFGTPWGSQDATTALALSNTYPAPPVFPDTYLVHLAISFTSVADYERGQGALVSKWVTYGDRCRSHLIVVTKLSSDFVNLKLF